MILALRRLTFAFGVLVLAAATAGAVVTRPLLLAIFAHPDDEILISGFLREAERQGIPVRAVYLTSGDAGKDRSGRELAGAALRVERERELKDAWRRLGLAPPGLLRYPDGHVWQHRESVQNDLSRIFEEYRPRWVLAFGPDGVTGHADHVASGVMAAEVFDRTGVGDELWCFAVSAARTVTLAAHLKQFGVHPVAPARIHRTVDVSAHVGPRIASMKTHHTQFPSDVQALLSTWFTRFPVDELIRVRGTGPLRLPWER